MKNRQDLKKLFINGAKPSEKDFEELIDSSFNKLDEPRQEVVSNAGWYYFAFLPRGRGYPTFSNEFEVRAARGGGTTSVQGLPLDRRGFMNIFIPKGVSRVTNFVVSGYVDVKKEESSVTLEIWLYKNWQQAVPPRVIESPVTNRISEYWNDDINITINPNRDFLTLEARANINDKSNALLIHSMGIQFS